MVQVVVTRGRRVVNKKKAKAKTLAVNLERRTGGGRALMFSRPGFESKMN